jgi:hypothetical protein
MDGEPSGNSQVTPPSRLACTVNAVVAGDEPPGVKVTATLLLAESNTADDNTAAVGGVAADAARVQEVEAGTVLKSPEPAHRDVACTYAE